MVDSKPPLIKQPAGLLRVNNEISLRRQVTAVFLGYVAIAAIEVVGHWVISIRAFHSLMQLYLMHTPSGGVSIFVDLLLPSCMLGWWNGLTGKGAPRTRALALGPALALGVVALLPLYVAVIDVELWWWPKEAISVGLFLGVELSFAMAFVLGTTAIVHGRRRTQG
jgi:hypothetical protein